LEVVEYAEAPAQLSHGGRVVCFVTPELPSSSVGASQQQQGTQRALAVLPVVTNSIVPHITVDFKITDLFVDLAELQARRKRRTSEAKHDVKRVRLKIGLRATETLRHCTIH
jgi:hypothetical protein